MLSDPELNLYAACAVGMGGSLIGLLGLLLNPRRGWTILGLLVAVLFAGVAAGLAILKPGHPIWMPLAGFSGLTAAIVLLRSSGLRRAG